METDGEKTEQGFINYLVHSKKKTRAQSINEIKLAIYNQIIEDPENKLSEFITEKNRGRKQPLSFARLKKTFFQYLLVPPPLEDEFESDSDFRNYEKNNLKKIMNIIVEEGLKDKWNPELNDNLHKKTQKIFSAGAVRAWTILLRDTINTHLRHYSDEQRDRFLYRTIQDSDFDYFRRFTRKIFSHKLWDDPDSDGQIEARLSKDDAQTAKMLFDQHRLDVNWILGGGI